MTTQSSKKHIRKDEPPGFKQVETLALAIMYEMRKKDYYFRYKVQTYPVHKNKLDEDNLFASLLNQGAWSGPISPDQIHQVLHIDIWADTLVDVTAVQNGIKYPLSFSFHPDRQAVMTVDDHTNLYGELLYEKPDGTWATADKMNPTEKCTRIQFKAKHNEAPVKAAHKFSYYVHLNNENGEPTDLEIDPDVRNPPVDEPKP